MNVRESETWWTSEKSTFLRSPIFIYVMIMNFEVFPRKNEGEESLCWARNNEAVEGKPYELLSMHEMQLGS